MPFLITHSDSDVEQRVNIGDDIVVLGRHPDCSVVVDDPSVSRRHAQIVQKNGKYLLEDLESRNGTFLNRRMIQQSTRLLNGDQIRICDALFTFYLDESIQTPMPRQTQENPSQSIANSILMEDLSDSNELSSIMHQMDVGNEDGTHYPTEMVASPEAKLTALIEITKALAKTISMDKVLLRVLECLFDLFKQADRGFIVMADADGDLKPLAMKLRREDEESTIRISRTIVRHVLEKRQAIISTDAASDERFDLSQSITDFRIRSMMCAPLFDAEGNSVGVIQLDSLRNSVSFQNEDMDVLATVALQAGAAIDKAKLYQREIQQQELSRDLELANEIQHRLLPNDPPEMDGYELFDYYRPAEQVGGDYYDYIPLSENRMAILVGDVVGHGIAAALLMAKVSAEARFALASNHSASQSMAQLNNAISKLDLDRFITIVLVLLDFNSNEATIVNAGHLPPVVRRQAGAEALSTDQSGLPAGIMEDTEYEEFSIPIHPGDVLVLYTDGVNEAQDRDGQLFGNNRVISHLDEKVWESASDFGNSLIAGVRQHLDGSKQEDDVCLVCLRRK